MRTQIINPNLIWEKCMRSNGGGAYERGQCPERCPCAAGIGFAVDGEDLLLNAPSAPTADVLDALARHKAEIVVLLRPGPDGWSAEGQLGTPRAKTIRLLTDAPSNLRRRFLLRNAL